MHLRHMHLVTCVCVCVPVLAHKSNPRRYISAYIGLSICDVAAHVELLERNSSCNESRVCVCVP